MVSFHQTAARVGAGISAMGALSWLLWDGFSPQDFEPEPLFTFATIFCTWIFTEIKKSEEVNFSNSSKNDIRVARQILALHHSDLRVLLHDTDIWIHLDSRIYKKLSELTYDADAKRIVFQNRKAQELLENFIFSAEQFNKFIAFNTVPDLIGGVEMIGFKPVRVVTEDEYKRRKSLSEKANKLADSTWHKLDLLATYIRKNIPESLDTPVG